jgi:putative DNA primase/helicase
MTTDHDDDPGEEEAASPAPAPGQDPTLNDPIEIHILPPPQPPAEGEAVQPSGNTLRVVVNNDAPSEKPPGGAPPGAGGNKPVLGPVEFSDDMLAEQLSRDLGNDWRYVPKLDQWVQWDGQRWAARHEKDLIERSTDTCRLIANQIDKDQRLARAVSSRKAITAAVFLTSARERHKTPHEAFDRNIYYLGTSAGIVDLREGLIYAHDRAALITRLTGCEPAGIVDAAGRPLAEAAGLVDMHGRPIRGGIKDSGHGIARLAFERALSEAPNFARFLRDVTGADAELQNYLQRVSGYCLTGDTSEHAVFFAHGPGATGKSTFISLLLYILGDYATPAPMNLFLVSKGERHPTELALLHGARLVTASETEEGRRWDEAKVKQLTGGDKITARYMRADFFTFDPRFKLFLAGNFRPVLRSPDEAMRRRMRVIPFVRRPARIDKGFIDKLKAEAPSILTWMIAGAVMWWKEGLDPPASVTEATNEYFAGEDTVGRWIEERCSIAPTAQALTAALLSDFKSWAATTGEFAGFSERVFAQKLETRGYARWRDGAGRRGFKGIEPLVKQEELGLGSGRPERGGGGAERSSELGEDPWDH